MKKITFTMNVDDTMSIKNLNKYIEGTDLFKNTDASLRVDEIDGTPTRTKWIAFPNPDNNNNKAFRDITHGSIISFVDLDPEEVRKWGRWSSRKRIYDIVGCENFKYNDEYIFIHEDAYSHGDFYTLVDLELAYRLYSLEGMEGQGVIRLLEVDDLFTLSVQNRPLNTNITNVLKLLTSLNSVRRNNGLDTTDTIGQFSDLYYQFLSARVDNLVDEVLTYSINTLFRHINYDAESVDVVLDLICKLLGLGRDKNRIFYKAMALNSVRPNSYSLNTHSRVKMGVLRMMRELGFVTDLEVEVAQDVYSKTFNSSDSDVIARCQYAILEVYYSFMVREDRVVKVPKYATDYFEFSLQLTQQANVVINRNCASFISSFVNIDDKNGANYSSNTISEHYELAIKPLVVNLAKAIAKDPMLFKTYADDTLFLLNTLIHIIGDNRLLADFTNSAAPYIETLTPKLAEVTVLKFMSQIRRADAKNHLFNNCVDCKKVKSAVMLGKLAK